MSDSDSGILVYFGGGALGLIGGGSLICCGALLVIGALLVVILVPLSVHTVRYDEYGILHNTITRTIDTTKVYEPGRYFPGPGHEFIIVPRVLQNVDFSSARNADGSSLETRTKDGLEVTVEISFQYTIKKEDILELFNLFALNFRGTILSVARDALRDAASTFTAIQFFEERDLVGNAMKNELKKDLERIKIYLEFFQLRGVSLPRQYERVIEEKEISRQLITQAQFAQRVAEVTTNTGVMVSRRQVDATLAIASGNADRTKLLARADADRIYLEAQANSDAYGYLKTETNMTNTDILRVMWMHTLRKHHSEARYIVDLKRPAIIDLN